jgi:chemotaxis signal transduction protein
MKKKEEKLKKRTAKIAKVSEKKVVDLKRYLSFYIGEKQFAVSDEETSIITQNTEVRILSKLQPPLIGIVNFKGTIYSVIDLNLLFGKKIDSNVKNLIFLKNYYLALSFTQIDDMVKIPLKTIKSIANSDIEFVNSFFISKNKDVYIIDVKEFYETYFSSR